MLTLVNPLYSFINETLLDDSTKKKALNASSFKPYWTVR